MTRYGSATTILGRLPSGLTVTMALYKASDGSSVAITNTCTEIGSTGVYRWPSSNITTQPTVETDYFYRMITGQYQYEGKFTLQAATGASAADIADAVLDELTAGHTITGSLSKAIIDILEDTGTTIPAAISTRAPANEYDTEVGYIPSNLGDVPTDTELDTAHGSGSWEGTTPSDVADAVWDELKAGHTIAGSYGNEVTKISKKLDRNLVWLLP